MESLGGPGGIESPAKILVQRFRQSAAGMGGVILPEYFDSRVAELSGGIYLGAFFQNVFQRLIGKIIVPEGGIYLGTQVQSLVGFSRIERALEEISKVAADSGSA